VRNALGVACNAGDMQAMIRPVISLLNHVRPFVRRVNEKWGCECGRHPWATGV
jgi:hypothetical protein